QGRSAVLQQGLTNVQSHEGFFWRATLWATQETPVDNTIEGDRSQTPGLGAKREPFPNGFVCRALEISPDNPDAEEERRLFSELNPEVRQKDLPSKADMARHPTMHRTDTLDCLTCVRGEIYLVTDPDEGAHAARRHGHRPRRQPRLEQPVQRTMPARRHHDRRHPVRRA